jgi:hypothetical protein
MKVPRLFARSNVSRVRGTLIAKLAAGRSDIMEIRFISSLTSEDENAFAPAVLKALSSLLDQLPIAYTLRIETSGAQVFQHTHVAPDELDVVGTV